MSSVNYVTTHTVYASLGYIKLFWSALLAEGKDQSIHWLFHNMNGEPPLECRGAGTRVPQRPGELNDKATRGMLSQAARSGQAGAETDFLTPHLPLLLIRKAAGHAGGSSSVLLVFPKRGFTIAFISVIHLNYYYTQ